VSAHPESRSPNRRERPAKPALTREGIIDAALSILEDEGLEKVTMRRIATALDTGPASLYVYVRNTADLHAQILDELLDPVATMSLEGTWREQLSELLTRYARVLFDHPEIARITMTTQPVGQNYFAIAETVLRLLNEGNVSDATSAWAIDLLLASVTASAVAHGADREQADARNAALLAARLSEIDAEKYPRIATVGSELLSGEGPDRFAWALDALINGILATPRRI
jgi:AcrR family transcriptional regulator